MIDLIRLNIEIPSRFGLFKGLKMDFSITLLGTGCPAVSTTRYGAATLVRAGGQNLLVDVGSGVTQRLVAAGLNGADIDAVLITHMHSDHLIDFYQFIISSWHQSRTKPQKVFGPKGIKKFVSDAMAVWDDERNLRIEFEQRTSTTAFEIEVFEFEDETPIIQTAHLTVKPIKVMHEPVDPAFGFCVEASGKKAVLSGDTRYCDNLIKQAQNADLLIHEVFIHGCMEVTGTRSAKGLKAVESYHTLSSEVGKIATKANVKALALTHIVPPDADRAQLISQAKADYGGPVIVGEDLMRFDLTNRQVHHGDTAFSF